MADWIPFPSPEDMPDPSGMDRTSLLAYLESLRERIAQLDEQEPEDMEAPEYEVWADQHEALEDLTDEIRDLLDGMGGNA